MPKFSPHISSRNKHTQPSDNRSSVIIRSVLLEREEASLVYAATAAAHREGDLDGGSGSDKTTTAAAARNRLIGGGGGTRHIAPFSHGDDAAEVTAEDRTARNGLVRMRRRGRLCGAEDGRPDDTDLLLSPQQQDGHGAYYNGGVQHRRLQHRVHGVIVDRHTRGYLSGGYRFMA